MADQDAFDPTQFGAVAVAEPQAFDPTQHGAIPVQPPQTQEPSILQKTGRAVVDTLKGFLPQSVEDVALAPVTMFPGVGQAYKSLANIAFGRPASEGVSPLAGIPVVQRIPQIIAAEKTPALSQERFTTGAGVVADLAMLAGFKGALREAPKLADITEPLIPKAPEAAATSAPLSETAAVETATQPTGEPNAVQEQSASSVLQHPQEAVGEAGSQRVGVEPSVQGQEVARPRETGAPPVGNEPVAQESVARPEPPEPSTFSAESPTDAFGSEHTPVTSALINDVGGVVGKSAASKSGRLEANPELWDDVQNLSHPTHNKIYNPGGEMPDVAAQALHDAGLIADPSPTTMWKAIADESKSARSTLKDQQGQAADIKQQAGQVKDFSEAQHDEWEKGKPVVQVKDLQVGDTVTVKGESLKVTDIDPDTFDVTLEDGKKYGVQSVKDNTVIYGEHEAGPVARTQPETLTGIKPVSEKIASAATKLSDGKIVDEGPTHGSALGYIPKDAEAGFLTTDGRFVGREEAWDIAKRNRQINKFAEPEEENRAAEENRKPELLGEDFLEPGHPQISTGVRPVEPTAPIAEQPKTVPTPAETQALNGGEDKVGIAERYREEQQPGSVIPGVGRTADEARAWGQDFINKGGNPYNVIANKGPKRELWQDVGVVRAEYERLSNEKRTAENALEANPNDPQAQMAFDNADMAQRKWSKDAQPVLTRAGDALRAASRSYPREINSFSDFTDIVNDHFKGEVELTPEKRAELQKAVKAIRKGNVEATDARAQVTNAAVKNAGGKTMSFDDLKASLTDRMTKLLENCPT